MKKIYKSIFLTPFFLILSIIALAQCDFRGGDIAFTGYHIFDDNAKGSSKDDVFSFVLLRDAPAGLEIFFTDLGWIGTKFQEKENAPSDGRFQVKENAPSDGIIKWSTDKDIPAGTQITITAKFNLTASMGQVAGVQNTQFGNYLDLGIAGDQLFAFTGSLVSPTLLAGININKPNWDNRLDEGTLSSSSSEKPVGNNVQYISIGYQNTMNPFDTKAYNAVLIPGPYNGKVSEIINRLNNFTNWVTDGTIYPNPIPPNFALPTNATFTISPPEITLQPEQVLACLTDKAEFSVSVLAGEACAYFWEVSTDGEDYTPIVNDEVYSGVNSNTLKIANVDGLNGYLYRVKVKGAIETYSKPAKLEVIIDDLIQSGPTGNTEITYGDETTFSFTVSKYANDFEWHVSKDKGVTFQVIAEDDSNYEGINTSALRLVKPTVAMNGYRYKLLLSDKCDGLYSDIITLTVVKKELTVKAKNIIKIYDGLPFTEVEVESYTGFEFEEDKTVLKGTLAYHGEEAINVSDDPYDIVIEGLEADNYEIIYEDGELTIEPAPLTITANPLTKVYGEANPLLTFVYDGLVNGETSIADIKVSTVADANSVVGDYPITVSGSASNYTIDFVEGVLSVTPKAVTVRAVNKSKIYGEDNPVFTLTYTGLVNDETSIPNLSVSTVATTGSSVGTYAIVASGTSANYAITFVEGVLSVTPKAVTVSAVNKSKVYGEANPEFTLDYDGLVNGETSIAGLTASTVATTGSPVGTYVIQASGTANNYTITFVEGVLSVTPKAVTVSAVNKSKVYGDNNPEFTLDYDGLVNGETSIAGLTASTVATTGSPVGTYPIVVTGNAANYTISFVEGVLGITPKAVTVSAVNKSKVYGEDNPALTLAYNGLVNEESSIAGLTVSTVAKLGSAVGTYAIEAAGTSANYAITFVNGTLSIMPKAVTVSAVNKSKVYGEANPALTLAYDGLVNEESSIAGLTVSTIAKLGSPVGTYAIVASGTAANYTITFVEGVLSVTPKAVTVSAVNKSKVYGEANPTLTLAYDGLVNEETSIPNLSVSTVANANSPVGDYAIEASGTADNYTITFVEGTLKVTPKAITVTAVNKSKVYGEANPELTLSYVGLANEETSIAGLTVSTVATTGSPVGTYPIVATGTSSNYAITFVEGALSVTPKAVAVIAVNKSKVYGEENPTLTLAYGGLVNEESSIAGLTVSTVAKLGSPVGTYAIVAAGTSTNYDITFVNGTLSITPKGVTVSAVNKSKVYGEANPALTLAYDGLVNEETSIPNLSVSTVAKLGSPVGTYAIVASGTSANYTITFVEGVLSVTPKAVTVSAVNKSKVYGEANPTLTLAYQGLVNEETSIPNLSVSTIANANSPVGDYAIEASGTADNYSITFVEGTLKVTPKAVTVTAVNKSKVYGEVNPLLTLTYAGLVNGETSISGLSVSTLANASSSVGNYPIEVSGSSANYAITFVEGSLSVTPKAVTVSAVNKSKVYGEENPTLTLAYVGLVNEESSIAGLTVSTVANASSPVGDYAIEASGTTNNYTITFVEGVLNVTPKAVTVSAVNKSKTYGDNNPALTLAYVGLVNDETSIAGLTVSTVANTSSPVGTYPIVVSGTSGNYTITFVEGVLSVTPKAVTVSAVNKSKVYGEDNPTFTLEYVGLVNGETSIANLTVSTVATKGSAVGSYPIVVTGTSANYEITFVEGTLSVTPKAVTVSAVNKSKVYGENNPAFTLTYNGLVNEETSIANLLVSTEADEHSSVGSYDIEVSGVSANYDITFVTGTLNVTPKAVKVSAEDKSKIYGDDNSALTLAYDGLVNEETSIPNLSVTTTANAGSPVGTYSIVVSGTSANYTMDFVEGILTVTPKAVTVSVVNKSKVYGEVNPTLTLAYDGLVNEETFIEDLSVSTTAKTSSAVGDYVIEVSGTSANYTITFVQGTLTVTPKAVMVTAENKTKVYGGANPLLTLAYDGLVNGETSIANLAISTSADANSRVGDYAIQVSGTANNYSITFVDGVLSVTPKAVTVSAENKSKVYGEDNPPLTLVYDGLVNGETSIGNLSVSTLANTSSPVGDYIIGVSGVSHNYSIKFVEGILSITRKNVTVSADNKSKVYGDANPILTLTYDGLTNGETSISGLSVSTVANASSAVGDYSIAVSGTSKNYRISFLNGILKINRKSITITANNQTKVYGKADPELSYTIYPNLVNNDKLFGKLDRISGENVGSYSIRQNTLGASANYDLSYIAGELTIEKENLSGINLRSQSVTYNGKEHRLGVDNLPEGAKVIYLNNGQTNAGTYTVIATIKQDNYNDLVLNGVLSILKANANIDADDIQNHVYDGTVKNVKASLDHNETTLSYSQKQGYSEAGTYEITVSSQETDNYLASTKKVRLTIQQGSLNGLVFKDKEIIYNGKPQSILLENAPKGSRVEYSGNEQSDAGSYTVTAHVIDPNFTETILSASLVIRKAKQQITFGEVGTLARNIDRVALKVSTNSGLPIKVESDDKLVASVVGNDLLIHRLGTARLTASQEGNKNYEAAAPVSISVRVEDEEIGSVNVHPALSPNGDGINDFLIIEGIKDFPENRVRIVTKNGMVVFRIDGYDNDSRAFNGIANTGVSGQTLPIGTYFYFAEYKEGGKWKMKKGWFVMK